MENKPLSLCWIFCICYRVFHTQRMMSLLWVCTFICFLYSLTLQQTVKICTSLNHNYLFSYYFTLSYLFQPDLAWRRKHINELPGQEVIGCVRDRKCICGCLYEWVFVSLVVEIKIQVRTTFWITTNVTDCALSVIIYGSAEIQRSKHSAEKALRLG